MLKPELNAVQLVDYHTKLVNRCAEYRTEWEQDCKLVEMSYKGNKYPVNVVSVGGKSVISKEKEKPVLVNMIKRQYRVMANYLMNNEPTYVITWAGPDFQDADTANARAILDETFEGPLGDEGEGDMTFFETQMDDVVKFALRRGICYTLAWHDSEEKRIKFRTFDPLDCYIDIDARKATQIRDFVFTYVLPIAEAREKWKYDEGGNEIKWDDVGTDRDSSLSEVKKSLLKEKDPKNQIIVREGYHVCFSDGKKTLYRVLTTSGIALERQEIKWMDYVPVSVYVPTGDDDELFPYSWYSWMLPIDRKINEVLAKFSRIIDTGGRYVYVRKGTKLSTWTDKFLNSLGIEVIEIANAQEVPQQANLMAISQQDSMYLDFLMKQAEDEGGMKSDLMGSPSLGAEASGKAIQALQAGSKNNMGTALNELNKYMSRLTRIVLDLHSKFTKDKDEAWSKEHEGNVRFDAARLSNVSVRVSVTARNAFDEITQEQKAMNVLEYLARLSPGSEIKPSTITKILGVDTKMADDIQRDLDEQQNPDAMMAEAENRKMLMGSMMNASESDDHDIHTAIHSEMLKTLPPESDAANVLIEHMRMHEAFGATSPAGSSLQPQ